MPAAVISEHCPRNRMPAPELAEAMSGAGIPASRAHSWLMAA
jgi:hypothetical protein